MRWASILREGPGELAFLWGPGSLKGKEALGGLLPLEPETWVCDESLSVGVSGNKMKEMIGTQVGFALINFHLHLLTKKKKKEIKILCK